MIDRSSITEAARNQIRSFIGTSKKTLWPSLISDMFGINTTVAAQLLAKFQPKPSGVRRVI
jgi:hypothetical protein